MLTSIKFTNYNILIFNLNNIIQYFNTKQTLTYIFFLEQFFLWKYFIGSNDKKRLIKHMCKFYNNFNVIFSAANIIYLQDEEP